MKAINNIEFEKNNEFYNGVLSPQLEGQISSIYIKKEKLCYTDKNDNEHIIPPIIHSEKQFNLGGNFKYDHGAYLLEAPFDKTKPSSTEMEENKINEDCLQPGFLSFIQIGLGEGPGPNGPGDSLERIPRQFTCKVDNQLEIIYKLKPSVILPQIFGTCEKYQHNEPGVNLTEYSFTFDLQYAEFYSTKFFDSSSENALPNNPSKMILKIIKEELPSERMLYYLIQQSFITTETKPYINSTVTLPDQEFPIKKIEIDKKTWDHIIAENCKTIKIKDSKTNIEHYFTKSIHKNITIETLPDENSYIFFENEINNLQYFDPNIFSSQINILQIYETTNTNPIHYYINYFIQEFLNPDKKIFKTNSNKDFTLRGPVLKKDIFWTKKGGQLDYLYDRLNNNNNFPEAGFFNIILESLPKENGEKTKMTISFPNSIETINNIVKIFSKIRMGRTGTIEYEITYITLDPNTKKEQTYSITDYSEKRLENGFSVNIEENGVIMHQEQQFDDRYLMLYIN